MTPYPDNENQEGRPQRKKKNAFGCFQKLTWAFFKSLVGVIILFFLIQRMKAKTTPPEQFPTFATTIQARRSKGLSPAHEQSFVLRLRGGATPLTPREKAEAYARNIRGQNRDRIIHFQTPMTLVNASLIGSEITMVSIDSDIILKNLYQLRQDVNPPGIENYVQQEHVRILRGIELWREHRTNWNLLRHGWYNEVEGDEMVRLYSRWYGQSMKSIRFLRDYHYWVG